MSDAAVRDLARKAGIAVVWEDHAGKRRRVSVAVVRRILSALGLPCETAGDLRHSQEAVHSIADASALPLITATVGEPVAIAEAHEDVGASIRVAYEGGATADIRPRRSCSGKWMLPPIATAGYHRVELGRRTIDLAVAPARCFTVEDAAVDTRIWGLAAQLYGLRRGGDGGIGDTTALAMLAQSAARQGADAIAISPAHAGFAADPGRYRPYSPSSRLFLNPLHADPRGLFGEAAVARAVEATGLGAEFARLEAAPLIDWPAAVCSMILSARGTATAPMPWDTTLPISARPGATFCSSTPASRRCTPIALRPIPTPGRGAVGPRPCATRTAPQSKTSRRVMSARSCFIISCNGSRTARSRRRKSTRAAPACASGGSGMTP